jgi:serine/threonine protein kinase
MTDARKLVSAKWHAYDYKMVTVEFTEKDINARQLASPASRQITYGFNCVSRIQRGLGNLMIDGEKLKKDQQPDPRKIVLKKFGNSTTLFNELRGCMCVKRAFERAQQGTKLESYTVIPRVIPQWDRGVFYANCKTRENAIPYIRCESNFLSFLKKWTLTKQHAVRLIETCMTFLKIIHSDGIIHDDMKFSNVLVKRSEKGAVSFLVGDFGLTCPKHLMNEHISTPLYSTPYKFNLMESATDRKQEWWARAHVPRLDPASVAAAFHRMSLIGRTKESEKTYFMMTDLHSLGFSLAELLFNSYYDSRIDKEARLVLQSVCSSLLIAGPIPVDKYDAIVENARKVQSRVQSRVQSKVQSKIQSKVQSKIQSRDQSKIQSRVQSRPSLRKNSEPNTVEDELRRISLDIERRMQPSSHHHYPSSHRSTKRMTGRRISKELEEIDADLRMRIRNHEEQGHSRPGGFPHSFGDSGSLLRARENKDLH